MTSEKQAKVEAGMRRLGRGFIRKMRTALSTVGEMKKMAEGHGRCCPPCEIPGFVDYLEGVEQQLNWYLGSLQESSESKPMK